MQLLSILLMTPDPSGKGSSMSTIIMMGLMILVFWLFMIRPQAKKAKKQKEFINNLQKGDKIVTIAGIHGKIDKIEDNTIQLEVSPGSYLRIEKSAVSMEWSKQLNSGAAADKK